MTQRYIEMGGDGYPVLVGDDWRALVERAWQQASDPAAPFPLTDLQQAYWIGRTRHFDYHCDPNCYREDDLPNLDRSRVDEALNQVIQRYDALRIEFISDSEQRVQPNPPRYEAQFEDLRGHSEADAKAALLRTRERMARKNFCRTQWPFLEARITQISDTQFRLHTRIDLLIDDPQGALSVRKDLLQLIEDPNAALPPVSRSFREYALAMNALREHPAHEAAWKYWNGILPTLPPAPTLPKRPGTSEGVDTHFGKLVHLIEEPVWVRLRTRALAAGVSPSMILCAILCETLAGWSKNARFTVTGMIPRLRLFEDIARVLGSMSSTIVHWFDGAEGTFASRARALQERAELAISYSLANGVAILREYKRMHRLPSSAAGMPINYISNRLSYRLEEEVEVTVKPPKVPDWSLVSTPQVTLEVQPTRTAKGVNYAWLFAEEAFPDGLMEEMFAANIDLVRRLADDASLWEAERLDVLPPAQRELRKKTNATQAESKDTLLHVLASEHMATRADAVAVQTAQYALTYRKLTGLADALAAQLRNAGAKTNRLIAIVMDKGWEQVVAALGIQRAGGAYLPIDASLPQDRIDYLLEDGGVELAVTQPAARARYVWPKNVRVFEVTADAAAVDAPLSAPASVAPDDLAYVIYTSGSSGKPKGVAIEHRGAVNTVLDINERFAVGPSDATLALSALSFDLSVFDVFGLLGAGGKIVIPERADAKEPQRWLDLIQKHGVTIWNSVPALLEMFVGYLEARKMRMPEGLRLVMLSGDFIPLSLPGRVRALGGERIELISLGGATEASIWSNYHRITKVEADWSSIPYGVPLRNQTMYVLDETLRTRPNLATGHIHIGGVGLAREYWNLPERTARSFFVHRDTGERLYRTGDLGRYMPNGEIEILGREDSQVKVGGFRIELGEIEAALSQLPSVRQAVVLARAEGANPPPTAPKRLIAYVNQGADAASSDDLRAKLRQTLPEYMVPTLFVFLERFPLSANGKVDRAALPDPAAAAEGTRSEHVAPRDDIESGLVGIWQAVLGIEKVGVRDDFFQLGGDSLKALRLVTAIYERFGRELRLANILEAGTVERLAKYVRGDSDGARPAGGLLQLRAGTNGVLHAIHPIGGSVLCYSELVRRLPDGVAVWGTQSPALEDPAKGFGSIEDMAASYLTALRTVQPKGPYKVLGWSLGGLVALEIGRRLEESGETVDVCMIDSDLDRQQRKPDELFRWFAKDLAGMTATTEEPPPIADDIDPAIAWLSKRVNLGTSPENARDRLLHLFQVFRKNADAWARYRPAKSTGKVFALRASEEPAEDAAWLSALGPNVVVETIPGDHYSVMRAPKVEQLAARVAEWYRR